MPCDDPEWSKFTRFFAENFERLGLKKLISTSYAAASKKIFVATKDTKKHKGEGGLCDLCDLCGRKPLWYQPSLFEQQNPHFDAKKTAVRGKIFVLDHDTNANGRIDLDDLQWNYMEGDGDFRSAEVCRLRDEADVIVTNPPFSLFREFLSWILAAKDAKSTKQFLIIGNMNTINTKDVFPLVVAGRLWLGATGNGSDMVFAVPEGSYVDPKDRAKAAKLEYVGDYTRLGNSCWYTNMEHGRRHQPLQLMTMADNLRYSRHKEIKEHGYRHYDNYDAIEIPFSDAIPSDYDGMMGVPVSFLDK